MTGALVGPFAQVVVRSSIVLLEPSAGSHLASSLDRA
jgi:hypothetical protein